MAVGYERVDCGDDNDVEKIFSAAEAPCYSEEKNIIEVKRRRLSALFEFFPRQNF